MNARRAAIGGKVGRFRPRARTVAAEIFRAAVLDGKKYV